MSAYLYHTVTSLYVGRLLQNFIWGYLHCREISLKFWCPGILVDVMTYILRIFNVLTNFLTSWRSFLYHDELVDVMMVFLMSWHTFWCYVFWRHSELFDVIMYYWHQDERFWSHDILFDVMPIFLTSWRFWRHDERFWVMTCFWHYDELFDVMRNFLTSW